MSCSSRHPCVRLSTRISLCFVTLIALGTAPFNSWGAVPEYVTSDAPPPTSAVSSEGLLGNAFAKSSAGQVSGALRELWRDSSLVLRPRSYFFDRDREVGDNDQAWALGGSLEFVSGWWRNKLRFSSTLYTSQKLSADDETDTTKLLQTDQDGITAFGQAYVEAKLTEDIHARAGRTALNLPYVNKNDSRMVPITHEAYGLGGNWNQNTKFGIVHVRKQKPVNNEEFISMSEAAGAAGSNDPLTLIGMRYSPNMSWNVGATNQYAWNVMNTFYAEANASWALTNDVAISTSAQYTGQESTGDELIGRFDTYVYGARISASYRDAVLSLATSSTDENSQIRNPFGGYPGYLSLMISDFDKAGEDAWLIGFSYDFATAGIPGLSTFVNYAQGNTPDSGPLASPDQTETDITVDYRFKAKTLDGLWLRLRWGQLDQSGIGADDITDTRIILNYEVALF
ncbi:MAG: OprD family porin [Gammaproteobacteria bacterium]|nr:OprD family porin [Gammaproteobacteria bacterium]MBU2478188.1 OprD family porin [Gammaproteobacteria bacterium]